MHIAKGLYNDQYRKLKYFAMNHIDEETNEETDLKLCHTNVQLRVEELRHDLDAIHSRITNALLV